MKKSFTTKKALCFLLIASLMISSSLISAATVNADAKSEEYYTSSKQENTISTLEQSALIASSNYTQTSQYIVNVLSEKFLQKNGTYTVAPSTYSNTADLSWEIDYLGNGDYYIRSASNPSYGLFAIGNEVELGVLTSTSSPYYIWNLEIGFNGGYIIKNKGSETVLKVNGSALELTWSISPTEENYEQTIWKFVDDDKNVIFVDYYYDTGFSKRFSHIDTNAENLLRDYHDTVAERFSSVLNLEILPTYISYMSIADFCK